MDPHLFHFDWEHRLAVVAAGPLMAALPKGVQSAVPKQRGPGMLKLGQYVRTSDSTVAVWLAAAWPELTVVSARESNSYGHPRRTVIKAVQDFTGSADPHTMRWGWSVNNQPQCADLSAYNEAVHSTVTSGTVMVTSGGGGFEVRTAR